MYTYPEKEQYNIDDLVEIVRLLRTEDGCPWDKVQTHKSIRSDFIEETYEAIEAIDEEDPAMLREELGDVLLQVVFHSQIEREQNHFTLDDVTDEVCRKLILRHPHVFADVKADTVGEVLKNWDSIKEESKHQTTRLETMQAVAKTLPALMRGQKVAKRAAKPELPFANDYVALEAITEAKHNLEHCVTGETDDSRAEMLGELLYAICQASQTWDISAEQALTDAIERRLK